jgi:DNA-binding CsgD family transcriptional regulator
LKALALQQIPRTNIAKPHSYVALVAPLPEGAGLAGAIGEGRVGALVLVHDVNAARRSPAEALAAMFALTPRAAESTAALAAGDELKDYAERAGVTLHTARFHLKVAFLRLGVRGQAQLVRLAVRALADLNL